MEVREKDASERETGETPQMVCPAERMYKWDFILEKYIVENAEQEATSESRGIEQLAEDGFDKDYIVTHKRRKQQDRYYY